eukprot:469935-Alexandrium_andersonii.AAC.1
MDERTRGRADAWMCGRAGARMHGRADGRMRGRADVCAQLPMHADIRARARVCTYPPPTRAGMRARMRGQRDG